MQENHKTLDISWETILKLAFSLLAFYLLFLVRDILIWIVFALIISILFNPAIAFLRKFLPRAISAPLVYCTALALIGFTVYLVAPLFVSEIQEFSRFFPVYFEKISPPLRGLGIEAFENLERFTSVIEENLTAISSNVFNAIGVIFGGIFSTITIFTIALFLSLEEKGIERVIGAFVPKKYEATIFSLWERSQRKVSGWFGAKVLTSLFVGLMTLVICYFLKIDYTISFGLLSGISNLIPIVGPLAAGAVMLVIVAVDSWLKALFFLIALVLIQQIEGNILSPVLTNRFIGLPPALVLVSLLIGGKLWGIMGALLAIPIGGILFEFIKDFLKKKKEEGALVP